MAFLPVRLRRWLRWLLTESRCLLNPLIKRITGGFELGAAHVEIENRSGAFRGDQY
jgi:hypothetical protein